MRHNFPREFYIPKSETVTEIRDAETDAVAYTYESAGVLYALAFHGKANKPDWHYRFRSAESRAARIAEHAAGVRGHAVMVAETKAKRAAPVKLKPGDILSTCWGYDQTNVEFFQVTALVGGCMVEVREISAESETTGFMSGNKSALKDRFVGEPLRRRVKYGDSVKIDECRTASPWSGKPASWSSYA